jgi:hypothetical protein
MQRRQMTRADAMKLMRTKRTPMSRKQRGIHSSLDIYGVPMPIYDHATRESEEVRERG